MKEEIMEMLEEKLDQLFVELYQRHCIACGDSYVLEEIQLHNYMDKMADIICYMAERNKEIHQ